MQCISSLRPQFSHREIPEPIELSEDVVQDPAPIEVAAQIPQVAHPTVKRQRRTEILGSNPRERRAQIRDTLEQGFYLCRSGKKRIRTVHRLGDCFALAGVIMSITITWGWLCRNVRLMMSYADSVRRRMHARQERVPALRRVHPPPIRISEWQGILT